MGGTPLGSPPEIASPGWEFWKLTEILSFGLANSASLLTLEIEDSGICKECLTVFLFAIDWWPPRTSGSAIDAMNSLQLALSSKR